MSSAQQQPPHQAQTPMNYQFSAEELRTLRECNTESFFQRSLPLGTSFGVGTYMAVKRGLLQPNRHYGAVPKTVVAVIVGYFVGKFSYQNKCAEKMMKLPNSRLGEMLRRRRLNETGASGVINQFKPDPDLGSALTMAPFTSATDVYNDERPPERRTALDLDTDVRPNTSELYDGYRQTLDSSPTLQNDTELNVEPKAAGSSYEELRRRNREAYEKQQTNRFSLPLATEAPVVVRKEKPQEEYISTKRNKYGDSWQE